MIDHTHAITVRNIKLGKEIFKSYNIKYNQEADNNKKYKILINILNVGWELYDLLKSINKNTEFYSVYENKLNNILSLNVSIFSINQLNNIKSIANNFLSEHNLS